VTPQTETPLEVRECRD